MKIHYAQKPLRTRVELDAGEMTTLRLALEAAELTPALETKT